MLKGNNFISVNTLSQLVVTVTSNEGFCIIQAVLIFTPKMARIVYILDLNLTTSLSSGIIPHRLRDLKSQGFNHYPFLNYICILSLLDCASS